MTIEEKIKIPVGQACKQAGYMFINKALLEEKFECRERQQEENARVKAIAITAREKLKTEGRRCKDLAVNRNGCNFISYAKKSFFGDEVGLSYHIFYTKRAVVVLEPLESYTDKIIPVECFAEVEKARRIGVFQFFVAYPAFDDWSSKCDDPVILGKVGDDKYVVVAEFI